MPAQSDVELLRAHLAGKGPLWNRWNVKLHRGNILISDWNPPPDPADQSAFHPEPHRKHLRIVSSWPVGPFRLEWMRHTGRWWPLLATGIIKQIIKAIDSIPVCAPLNQHRAAEYASLLSPGD
jgi:hypothetical protein